MGVVGTSRCDCECAETTWVAADISDASEPLLGVMVALLPLEGVGETGLAGVGGDTLAWVDILALYFWFGMKMV